MLMLAIIIVCLFSLFTYLIVIYNNLISLKNNASKNWANIDVLLKQRYGELPKLIDTCKEYMTYEKDTLEKIVAARKTALSASEGKNLVALGQAENTLKAGLTQLFALAENYPNLKTNESFQRLQQRISELESDIADRREFYNDSVNRNNIRIQQFPDIFVARAFHFRAFELLTFNEAEIQDVGIAKQFKT
jgi:LemA protein